MRSRAELLPEKLKRSQSTNLIQLTKNCVNLVQSGNRDITLIPAPRADALFNTFQLEMGESFLPNPNPSAMPWRFFGPCRPMCPGPPRFNLPESHLGAEFAKAHRAREESRVEFVSTPVWYKPPTRVDWSREAFFGETSDQHASPVFVSLFLSVCARLLSGWWLFSWCGT